MRIASAVRVPCAVALCALAAGCRSRGFNQADVKYGVMETNRTAGMLSSLAAGRIRVCLFLERADWQATIVQATEDALREWHRALLQTGIGEVAPELRIAWTTSSDCLQTRVGGASMTNAGMENSARHLDPSEFVLVVPASFDSALNLLSGRDQIAPSVQQGRSFARAEARGIYLNAATRHPIPAVMLHEFGHLLGLADLYEEATRCPLPGQPETSPMYNCVQTWLTDDEIAGLRHAFRRMKWAEGGGGEAPGCEPGYELAPYRTIRPGGRESVYCVKASDPEMQDAYRIDVIPPLQEGTPGAVAHPFSRALECEPWYRDNSGRTLRFRPDGGTSVSFTDENGGTSNAVWVDSTQLLDAPPPYYFQIMPAEDSDHFKVWRFEPAAGMFEKDIWYCTAR